MECWWNPNVGQDMGMNISTLMYTGRKDDWYTYYGDQSYIFSEIKYMHLLYGLVILSLRVFKKDIQVHKGTYTRMFIAVLFMVVGNWKQYSCPSLTVDRWNINVASRKNGRYIYIWTQTNIMCKITVIHHFLCEKLRKWDM